MSHASVLLSEVVEAFRGIPCQIFVEGTVGAGGHARALLEAHPEIKRYLAFDRDPSALRLAAEVLRPWNEKVELIHRPFGEVAEQLREQQIEGIDGFLVDLGVSSMQLDQAERGFSFQGEGPLDMRMDPTADLTAATVVNRWSEKELGRILRDYGEEPRWRQAARAIVQNRPHRTTKDLVEALRGVTRGRPGLNPATLVFQAIRIAVNDELGELERGLKAATAALRPGGRLAVISFHRLEDGWVKRFIREEPTLQAVTKKPIVPAQEEQRQNRRSRSAKLRIAEKVVP